MGLTRRRPGSLLLQRELWHAYQLTAARVNGNVEAFRAAARAYLTPERRVTILTLRLQDAAATERAYARGDRVHEAHLAEHPEVWGHDTAQARQRARDNAAGREARAARLDRLRERIARDGLPEDVLAYDPTIGGLPGK